MRSPTPLLSGVSIDYGLGTRLGKIGGHRMIGHTGTGGGFNNVLLRFPDDDLTVVVLTNADGGKNSALTVAGRYVGNSTFMIAPNVAVKMFVQNAKATW